MANNRSDNPIVGDDGELLVSLPVDAPAVTPETQLPAESVALSASPAAHRVVVRVWHLLALALVSVTGFVVWVYTQRDVEVLPQPHRLNSNLMDWAIRNRVIQPADFDFAGLPACSQDFQGEVTIVAAVESEVDRQSRLFLIFADGDTTRDVCRLYLYSDAESPRWSPDGEQLLFSAVLDGQRDLFIWESPGLVYTLMRDPQSDNYGDWSQSGRTIWYLTANSLYEWTVGDTSGARSPRSRLVMDHAMHDLAVSPDGQHLAFVATPDGATTDDPKDHELFLTSTTHRDLRQLTFDNVPDSAPAWSPDGRWIVWVSGEPGRLWLYDTVDRRRFQFFDAGNHTVAAPVWLPEDDGIAFVLRANGSSWIVTQMFTGESRIFNVEFGYITRFDWR